MCYKQPSDEQNDYTQHNILRENKKKPKRTKYSTYHSFDSSLL